jgi:hypothetical protein
LLDVFPILKDRDAMRVEMANFLSIGPHALPDRRDFAAIETRQDDECACAGDLRRMIAAIDDCPGLPSIVTSGGSTRQ